MHSVSLCFHSMSLNNHFSNGTMSFISSTHIIESDCPSATKVKLKDGQNNSVPIDNKAQWRTNPLELRHNECNGVSKHQRLACLLNCLLRRRSKKTSKLHVTGLCDVNPPMTGGFPSQMDSNAENVSIWWRHYAVCIIHGMYYTVVVPWKLAQSYPPLRSYKS